MKNVVFVHGGDVMKGKQPVNPNNSRTYQLLFDMGKARGLHMTWSSIKYFHDGKFKKHVCFNGKKWKKVRKTIIPHYIFEKSIFRYDRVKKKYAMSAAAPYINPVPLQIIASDKMLTYLTFPKVVYPSISVRNKGDIVEGLKFIKTKNVVIKPISGAGGFGVKFMSRKDVLNFQPDHPHVMQEFIDCSGGIPDIFKGVHDFRLLFLGNKLFHAFYRTAAPGTMLCNVSQGGKRVVVPIKEVPQKLKNMSKVIQNRFAQFHNSFYSVDFIYDKKREPKIIEINTTSGLDNASGYDNYLIFVFNKLLDHIERFIDN